MTVSSYAAAPPFSRTRRPLRVPEPAVHEITASDGVQLRLTRFRAGARGPVILAHGLGVSSRIFATDTIATNLLEFLCEHEFDVWLLDMRVSIELPASVLPWTADDIATKDFPAAVATVRSITGVNHVDALVHCYGAATLFMSMLAGLQGVRSIVCSQVAVHAIVPWRLRLEAYTGFPTLLRSAGLHAVSARPGAHRGPVKRAYDGALRLLPRPASERCDSAACRRIGFLYGPLYRHDQLDPATHHALPELFGVSSIVAFEHLAAMVRSGHVVTADGRDEYVPHLDRLAIPITFIHGALNQCYLPAGTAATFDTLSTANGAAFYERHVVPGYGHIDCIFGKNAATDVYPLMLRHFDRIGS